MEFSLINFYLIIFFKSIGGLTVAAVIKYADNILKEFATSVSIIVTSFVSYYLLNDFIPNFTFIIGSLFVLVSTFFYNYEKAKTSTIETDDNNNF